MSSWRNCGFAEVFENVTSSALKLPRSRYASSGRYPVVDQGEDFIGGWSDDHTLVHPEPVPVIVYGDHTRAVKVLERTFIQGADGVKVLATKQDVMVRFGAWLLRAYPVPSKGYARHFADVRKQRFLIPSLPEQQAIVAAIETHFSRLDAAVVALTRAKANVKRTRASVLKAAVEGRLVPTEAALARAEGRAYETGAALLVRILDERRAAWAASGGRGKYKEPVGVGGDGGVGEVPEGWVWASMDSLLAFVTSGSRGWASFYADVGAPFIRIGDLNRGTLRIDWRTSQRVTVPETTEGIRTRVRPGDVLISITADLGAIGLVGDDTPEAYVNQHVAIVRPVSAATAAYIAWYLDCDDGGQRQFRDMKRGATKVGLGLDDIRSVAIALPPLAEQLRIVAAVDRRLSVLDALDRSLEANLARCGRLRQAILKRAFEGRLVGAGASGGGVGVAEEAGV